MVAARSEDSDRSELRWGTRFVARTKDCWKSWVALGHSIAAACTKIGWQSWVAGQALDCGSTYERLLAELSSYFFQNEVYAAFRYWVFFRRSLWFIRYCVTFLLRQHVWIADRAESRRCTQLKDKDKLRYRLSLSGVGMTSASGFHLKPTFFWQKLCMGWVMLVSWGTGGGMLIQV